MTNSYHFGGQESSRFFGFFHIGATALNDSITSGTFAEVCRMGGRMSDLRCQREGTGVGGRKDRSRGSGIGGQKRKTEVRGQ